MEMHVVIDAVFILVVKMCLAVYMVYVGHDMGVSVLNASPSIQGLLPALATLVLAGWFMFDALLTTYRKIIRYRQEKLYEDYLLGLTSQIENYQKHLADKDIDDQYKEEAKKFIQRLELDLSQARATLLGIRNDPALRELF